MRKEILVAIIAGIGVGLIIAFGVWRTNRAITTNETQTPVFEQVAQDPDFGLTLATPSDSQVISEPTVSFSGVTSQSATVVIVSEEDDYIFKPGTNGAFEQEVELSAGLNQFLVVAFDQSLQTTSQYLSLVYSNQFSKQVTADEISEATDSADALRQKVQEKINEVASDPVFLLGTITDKQETILQINNFELMQQETGEIAQIMVNTETVFVSATNKEQEYEDIALGDFIIAMGTVTNGNKILEAKRILVSEEPILLSKKVAVGTISEIVSKSATVTNPSETLEFVFGKTWKGPEISEFTSGEQVLVITDTIEGKNTVVLIEKLTDL